METDSKIRKIAYILMAMFALGVVGCEIHAHPFSHGTNHRYVHVGMNVVHYICDDPELEPYSYAPLSCDEYYDGICCDWDISSIFTETWCLWDDSCRWEYVPGSTVYY